MTLVQGDNMRRFLRLTTLAAATLALTLAVAACTDDDDPEAPGTPAATAAQPTSSPTDEVDEGDGQATEAPAPTATFDPRNREDRITVTASDFSYSPPGFQTLGAGPITVTLENAGSVPHTLTVYADEGYTTPKPGADTGQVAPGSSGEFTTTLELGEDWFFRCEVHPQQMRGRIAPPVGS